MATLSELEEETGLKEALEMTGFGDRSSDISKKILDFSLGKNPWVDTKEKDDRTIGLKDLLDITKEGYVFANGVMWEYDIPEESATLDVIAVSLLLIKFLDTPDKLDYLSRFNDIMETDKHENGSNLIWKKILGYAQEKISEYNAMLKDVDEPYLSLNGSTPRIERMRDKLKLDLDCMISCFYKKLDQRKKGSHKGWEIAAEECFYACVEEKLPTINDLQEGMFLKGPRWFVSKFGRPIGLKKKGNKRTDTNNKIDLIYPQGRVRYEYSGDLGKKEADFFIKICNPQKIDEAVKGYTLKALEYINSCSQ